MQVGVGVYCDLEVGTCTAGKEIAVLTPGVAFDDAGNLVGYVFCILEVYKNDNINTDRKTLYIDDLCVEALMRGKHIGKELYQYVLNYARSIDCYNVTLNVWACNPDAQAFYESCGMKPQKTGMETIL